MFFFFFNDTATTEIYTLSLHDALPISHVTRTLALLRHLKSRFDVTFITGGALPPNILSLGGRSEEHTSELQSQSNLVCRLLLEKKKNTTSNITTRHTTECTHSTVLCSC